MEDKNRSIDGLYRRSQVKPAKKISYSPNRVVGFGEKNKKRHPRASSSRVLNSRESFASEKIKKHRATSEEFIKPVESINFGLFQDNKTTPNNQQPESLKQPKSSRKEKTPDSKNSQTKYKKKSKKLLFLKISGLVLAIILAIIFVWSNGLISKITNGRSGFFDIFSSLLNKTELKKDSNNRTNILIFGTSGYEMNGSGHDGAQLTDSIMLISFNQEDGDVAMISLPRDLKVDGTCTDVGKINEAYWCSNQNEDNEESGANAIKDRVRSVLGLDIHYYAHINWGALVTIVDAIGGVDVTIDEDIQDTWTNTFIKTGETVHLNGEKALGLARARHGTSGGDFTRGNSQQKILLAIKDKVEQSSLGLTAAINLLNTLGDNLRTDMSLDEIKTGFTFAKDVKDENMRQISLYDTVSGDGYLTTAELYGISYVIPTAGAGNYTGIQRYVKNSILKLSDDFTSENAKIVILNGSGAQGVAGTERTSLSNAGFNVIDIGDAPVGEYLENYYIYSLSNKPATQQKLLEHYNVSLKPIETLPAGVDTNNVDFIIIIGL